jgi:CheY-like chemotaxis protein
MMGGNLTAQGKPNEGSQFTIVLPAKVNELAGLQPEITSGQLLSADAKAVRISDAACERRQYVSKVLIIDENPEICAQMQNLLQRSGFDALAVHSGGDALESVYAYNPDIVVLDMLLSGQDGWSVLTKIKQDPALEHIPVIAMSMMEDKSMGFALGAIDYLPKPIDTSKMLSLVNKNVRKNTQAPILVIETDSDIRESIVRSLQSTHPNIMEAERVSEAFTLMEQKVPCLIIHNLLMEDMDGMEFVSRLRANSQWRSIPHITFSPEDLSDQDHQRLQQSVNKVLRNQAMNRQQAMQEVLDDLNCCVGS